MDELVTGKAILLFQKEGSFSAKRPGAQGQPQTLGSDELKHNMANGIGFTAESKYASDGTKSVLPPLSRPDTERTDNPAEAFVYAKPQKWKPNVPTRHVDRTIPAGFEQRNDTTAIVEATALVADTKESNVNSHEEASATISGEGQEHANQIVSENSRRIIKDGTTVSSLKKQSSQSEGRRELVERGQHPVRSDHLMDDLPSSSIDDYLKIASFKHKQTQRAVNERFAVERASLQSQLEEAQAIKDQLVEQLEQAVAQSDALFSASEQQKKKLLMYETKFRTFKTFVDGIGKDFDALKKDAAHLRRTSERLSEESKDRAEEHSALLEELSRCTKHSVDTKTDALRMCQETRLELEGTRSRCDFLDVQLSEKVGLLTEARDRCASLESQLATLRRSNQDTTSMIASTKDIIMSEICKIQTAISSGIVGPQLVEMQETMIKELRKVCTQNRHTMEDMTSVKELIQALTENCTTNFEHNQSSTLSQSQIDALQTQVSESILEVTRLLGKQKDANEREDVHQRNVERLQEQLKTQNCLVSNLNAELSSIRAREMQLVEQNAALNSKFAIIQRESQSFDKLQEQLCEAKTQLQARNGLFASLEMELDRKDEMCRTLEATKSNMSEQVASLTKQVETLQTQLSEINEVENNVNQEIEKIRNDCAEYTVQFEKELNSRAENENRRLAAENKRLEMTTENLQAEVTKSKEQISELQQSLARNPGNEADLEIWRSAEQSLKLEIESLQAQLEEARSSLIANKSTAKEKLQSDSRDDLNIQLRDMTSHNTVMAQELSNLRSTIEDLRRERDFARLEIESCRPELDVSGESSQAKSSEKRHELQSSNAGIIRLKASCEEAIEKERIKGERQMAALQKQLAEDQAELQKAREEHNNFRTQIHHSWQLEQQKFEERTAEANRRVADAESQKNKAIGDMKYLRQFFQQPSNERHESATELECNIDRYACIAEETLQAVSNLSDRLVQTSSNSCHGAEHDERENNTPESAQRMRDPESRGPTNDAIKSALELRPNQEDTIVDTCRSDLETRRGAFVNHVLVQDSQGFSTSTGKSQPSMNLRESKKDALEAFFESQGSLDKPLSTGDSQIESQAQATKHAHFGRTSSVFTIDNDGMSFPPGPDSDQLSSLSSDIFSDKTSLRCPEENEDHVVREDVRPQSSRGTGAPERSSPVSGQRVNGSKTNLSPKLGGSARIVSDTCSTQLERDKYTFQKRVPRPNSASKLVRGYSARGPPPGKLKSGLNVRDSRGPKLAATSHSSSPDIVHTVHTRNLKTYQTAAPPSRRLSTSQPVMVNDPRLATKRKMGEVAENDAFHKKKKKSQVASQADSTQSRSFDLRPRAKDTKKTAVTNPRTLSQQDRNQFIGQLSSTPRSSRRLSKKGRGLRKSSKRDEYSERFAQELDAP